MKPFSALKKILLSIVGILLMIFGVAIAPLPGPLGVPPFMFGLILLLRNSIWVKRVFVRLSRRFPKLVGPVRAMLRPGAKVVALMWLNTLRMERRILGRKNRFMNRFRQEFKAILGMRFSRRRWQTAAA
ncbi:hypothetical protein ABAC460_04265 [Asticcacaulis sp. AC460]|uniref:hypothetical protein n=1 Tax=Asticcacaulis sp. AC460 TaxID=1282360 RepID=UPI0003C3D01E|nr:hypothetical protein [Asticcacaulis sp. AC460]ESQ92106.1 hypothetical protein ABAC460_04265 [Asticcacaulis sp. AC460]